jgi:hypothetical protein
MMWVCHLDTCPVGVATQNPQLRARFNGKPEFVVTFFEFIAEEVRQYLAMLGFRSLEEIVGRVDLLDTALAVEHWKASGLDLSPMLYEPPLPEGAARRCVTHQDHGLDKALDNTVIALAEGALEEGRPVRLDLPTTRSTSRSAARPASRSARSCRAASRCGSKATPTTTWARACPADGSWSGPPRRPPSPPKSRSSRAT